MNKLLKPGYLFFLFLLVGCSSQAAALTDLLPQAGVVPNWTLAEEARVYNRDNLFDMVDGQADAFFVYGFEQVATQRYQNAAGTILEVALWQLATPADAYGLFTSGLAGQPVAICPSTPSAGRCNEGDTDPGSRIAFWQSRYYVQVYGRQQVADTDLQAFAQAVATSLPQGGGRPTLVNRLPQAHLIERGFVFFHEEISIQHEVWLGGENILGLSAQTNGLLARYDLAGARVHLLLIQYPEAKATSSGLAALKAGQVEGLVAADGRDNLLGAVFGQVDPAEANHLLVQALANE